MKHWYSRIVAPLCMLFALLVLSFAVVRQARWGPRGGSADYVFRVTMRHYGVDARELERTIAVPLEDALGKLPGCKSILTSVEYATVRVSVCFDRTDADEALYARASDEVYRFYDTLPHSVQRPEIDNAREGDAPVWMAAVNPGSGDTANLLEKKIKPAFARIDGAGSVEIYGLEISETAMLFDRERLAVSSLDIEGTAGFLAMDDTIKSAGYISMGLRKYPVVADGRYPTVVDLGNALFYCKDSHPVALGAVARVETRTRKPDSISRVNGIRCPVIAVREGNGADLFALSAALGRELRYWEEEGVSMTILTDTGAELKKAFLNLVSSVLQSIAVISVAGFFLVLLQKRSTPLGAGARFGLAGIGMAAVPAILVVSLGVLAAMAVPIDTFALAGLAAGMGAAIDTCLLLLEELGASENEEDALKRVRSIAPSLAGGVATTVIALVPLVMYDYFGIEVVRLAQSIVVVNLVALGMGLVLLPPFACKVMRMLPHAQVQKDNPLSSNPLRRIQGNLQGPRRVNLRSALRLASIITKGKSLIPLLICLALGIVGIVSLLSMTPDPAIPSDDRSIVFHVEMESGTALDVSDAMLARLSDAITNIAGVETVQASAYRGYGTIAVMFDSAVLHREQLADAVTAMEVPQGFVWTSEELKGKRNWQIHVLGDESALCEAYAKELAERLAKLPFVQDAVLNFKEGAPDIVLMPNREKLAERGIDFFTLGRTLRFNLYGPVIYKRITDGREYDTRFLVQSPGLPDKHTVLDTLLPDGKSKVQDLVVMSVETDTSRIYRRDKRREATITITSPVMNPFVVKEQTDACAAKLGLPALYEAQFDRDTLRQALRLQQSIVPFALAALGIVLALAVLAESFIDALLVLAIVPPSLALPLVFLQVTGATLRPALICAFIAVSGVVVNAAVLLFDTAKETLRMNPGLSVRKLTRITLRRRAASLAATVGTTVVGTVPVMLLAGEQHEILRSLAFVTFWGVLASGLLAPLLLPYMLRVHIKTHSGNHNAFIRKQTVQKEAQ